LILSFLISLFSSDRSLIHELTTLPFLLVSLFISLVFNQWVQPLQLPNKVRKHKILNVSTNGVKLCVTRAIPKVQQEPGIPVAGEEDDNDDDDDDDDGDDDDGDDDELDEDKKPLEELGPGLHPHANVAFDYPPPETIVGVDPGNGAPFTFWEEGMSRDDHVNLLLSFRTSEA